ncbi:MAG: glucose-6-phosphate isomerase [Acidobacteria bacterium]|nr:glucose-6-phosphate isomerase [Acidobacteriota bacterium]
MNALELWNRYKENLCVCPSVGITLDISRMKFSDTFFAEMTDKMNSAYEQMDSLERGDIVNPDEGRMVGHYWLRDSGLAPTAELKAEIEKTVSDIKSFASKVHTGEIKTEKGETFKNILVVGIGGSALGPQFVANALTTTADKTKVFFFDNTDPDGMDKVLANIGAGLSNTLTIVISKSGGTKETRNGMLEAKKAYNALGLDFGKHAVAVTQDGSELYKVATGEAWITTFPMWDWVGGRTSELSAVGLLPAALQGFDIDSMLEGAKEVDAVTRVKDTHKNPSALMALMWYHAGGGRGKKDMVILPYKDRLELISRYLQQLVMESLGKQNDLAGNVVNQGIAVYGNKGSTDQHAYVQQLREGVHNFFVTFIEVLKDRDGESIEVDAGVTSGDYLSGFLQGTRKALYENERESMTITVETVNARTIGKLLALYERAVGFYGFLVGINAYHQPGVEAGKKAAGAVITVQNKILQHLNANKGQAFSLDELVSAIGIGEEIETAYKVLEHLSANSHHRVGRQAGNSPFDAKYSVN